MQSAAVRSNAQVKNGTNGAVFSDVRFVKAKETELRAVFPGLGRNAILVFLGLKFLMGGWSTPPRVRAKQIAGLVGVPLRSVQLAIDSLIDAGAVRRLGSTQDPRGAVYMIGASCDRFDRSSCDRFDRSRARDTLLRSRSGSRSLPSPPRDAPVDAAEQIGKPGGTVVDFETARRVARPFGSSWIDGAYVRRCLQRLADHGVELPSADLLARYASHELETTNASTAHHPPGVVFQKERLTAWLDARARREKEREAVERADVQARPAKIAPAVDHAEQTRRAKNLLASLDRGAP